MTEGNEIDWAKLEADFDQTTGEIGADTPPSANVHVYTADILAKHMLWNVVPCDMAEDVTRALGLNWASDDVEDMEHRESHGRLNGAASVVQVAGVLASHGTRAALMATIVANGVPEDIRERLLEESVEKLTPLVAQTTFGIIAELVDMDLLHAPTDVYGLSPLDGEDE